VEPTVVSESSPGLPGPACPACRCLNLLVLGDYGTCSLCHWKGTLTGAEDRRASDWCPGGESLTVPASPAHDSSGACLHEDVNALGYCNDCWALINKEPDGA
jgi:hypothetical protein